MTLADLMSMLNWREVTFEVVVVSRCERWVWLLSSCWEGTSYIDRLSVFDATEGVLEV